MSDELNNVTGLVQDLVNKVSTNRTARESIESQANDVLRQEEDRLKLIQELELDTMDDGANCEVSQAYAENIRLKMQLQRLQEGNEKCDELIGRFEKSLANLSNDTMRWVKEYKYAQKSLYSLYEQRLEEETHPFQDFKAEHDYTMTMLQRFHSNLSKARDNLPQ